jgi:formate-dependent nitrite reductase cytochrome c552 subunit
VLNQDVVLAIAPPDEARDLFVWLRGLPFVSQRGEFWVYHDVARAAMLRFRRAEAPAKWRSEQHSLAQLNAHWASESVKGTETTWVNADWVNYRREENYHLLCADPHGNLPKVLSSATAAATHTPGGARQWAALIGDAGRDTDNAQLKKWERTA